ncbi:hypothetical protein BKE38_18010 [Pseudoroseomonas deserti]|uniref:Alginate export domain-containing protein n=1 Tax=Teichococcus deserti TaxID=1817963 RepID=A0A1V2H164_9PROT|nr:alginate export family protein [Pseudoroseomonas deserti]ONG50536.1 hypothetical protein BKE38_18010 [Pseudoroseomonas deserti]
MKLLVTATTALLLLAAPLAAADPFEALKDIPLGGDVRLSLGGQLRERFESFSNPGFSIGRAPGAPGSNHSLLQRLLLQADLTLSKNVRAFLQLGRFDAFDNRGGSLSATQENRGDIVQAYLDAGIDLDAGWRLTLRGGRQEMNFGSGRLVSERDGPNLRRAFDGGRLMLAGPQGAKLDLFATRPVQPLGGSFDDSSNRGEAFFGGYATIPLATGLSADLYALGYEREGARFTAGTAFEQRQTFGTRLFGRRGAFDHDVELAGQTGSFGAQDIRAWTASADLGVTAGNLPWAPRLGLKADIASGDGNPRDGRLETFNALYPKVPYFTEAGLVAPANLVDLYPSLRLTPLPDVTLEFGWDILWRQQREDAVYRPVPFGPLPGTAGGSRGIGQQFQVSARWKINSHAEFRAWYVHFDVGPALAEAGGRDVDFLAAALSLTF